MFGFLQNEKGNIATLFGFMVFPVVIAIGAGVEFGNMANMRRIIQDAADAGALAAANKLNVLNQSISKTGVEATSNQTALMQLQDQKHLSNIQFSTTVDPGNGTVNVTGQATINSLFNVLPDSSHTISVSSTAETLNEVPLCVMHMDAGTFKVQNSSSIIAGGCLVHSNENISVTEQANIKASRIQAAGKVEGDTYPGGQGGALKIEDPFAKMDLSIDKTCKAGKIPFISILPITLTVKPGTHCGKFYIGGKTVVNLEPGEHYFAGEFTFFGNSRLQGKDVVIIYDKDSEAKVIGNASIDLSGRTTGEFAGFVMATTRDFDQKFEIKSSNVDKLLGTIYMPSAELDISANGNVAENSAWSVIIAKSINISNNAQLVINKNYVGSGVPVPEGVGNAAGSPRLTN